MRSISNLVFLRFQSKEWEDAFAQYFDEKFKRKSLTGLVLGAVLIMGDAAFDHLIQPYDRIKTGNAVRVFVLVPMTVVCFALSFLPMLRKHLHSLVAWLAILATPLMVFHLYSIELRGGYGLTDWVGAGYFSMLVLANFLLFGLRIKYSLWIGIYMYLAFVTGASLLPGSTWDFIAMYAYHSFTVLSLAVFTGYWREILIRSEFQLIRDLAQERVRLDHLRGQMPDLRDVFLCHSSEDEENINELARHLNNHGITTWHAPKNIQPGQGWRESIVGAITSAKVCLALLTRSAAKSEHVLREIILAKKYGIPTIPVFVEEDVELSRGLDYELAGTHYLQPGPERGWNFEAILAHLKAEMVRLEAERERNL